MICENGIEICIISYMKRVVSSGSMHDTGCLGLVHWDDPEGGYGVKQNSSSKRAGRSLKAGKQAPTRVCLPQLLLAGPAGWVGTDTGVGRGPGDEGRAGGLSAAQGPPAAPLSRDQVRAVVVQSLSRVPLFATPWTAARQASLSITLSRSLLKLMSIKSVMPSNHLILCCPLLLPPSIFPSIRVFSNESALCIRWPKC